jgi:hypothetical protein
MRVTIIRGDNMVYVDGAALPIDCSSLPADFHALQWYDTWGNLETIDIDGNMVNRQITDLSPYQSLVDSWNSTNISIAAAALAAAQAVAAGAKPAGPGAVNVIAAS